MAGAARILVLMLPTSMWLLAAAIMPSFGLQLLMLGLAVVTLGGGIMLLYARSRQGWRSMGRALGLHPMGKGAYVELEGKVRGVHIRIRREEVRDGRRRAQRTVIHLPTGDELRLPGLVTDPMVVRELVLPFASPEAQAFGGEVDADEEP